MCPSTRVVPHHLPADRICSKLPANRHLWYVHAGQNVVHEKVLTLVAAAPTSAERPNHFLARLPAAAARFRANSAVLMARGVLLTLLGAGAADCDAGE